MMPANNEGEKKITIRAEKAIINKDKQVAWICTTRVTLAVIGCLGFMNLYAQRINISVAIVCMVNHTAVALISSNASGADSAAALLDVNSTTATYELLSCSDNHGHSNAYEKDGEFVWSKQMQGVVLAAFFYGYIFTHIPGGILAQRFGGKRVLGFSLLISSIATLLCAVGGRVSPHLLIFLRVIIGLCQGFVFVSMHELWSKWAPPMERSKLIGFTLAGTQIGNIVTLPLSAVLCDYGFDGGWGSVFYVFGVIGVIWCIAWMAIVSDSPSLHPRITAAERQYIETSIGTKHQHLSFAETPWMEFAKSLPVWAIAVGHASSNWVIYMLLTCMPAYMKEVLKFDIKSNGFFSAVPYLFFWAFINISGIAADALRRKGWRTKNVRKILFGFASCSGVLLIALGFIGCEHSYSAVAVLSLATGLCGLQFPSVLVNHVDIAPPFAAVLLGLSNIAACIPGFLAPYLVKRLTPNSSQSEWQFVFCISAAIFFVGAIFYGIFADGEVQDWAKGFMISQPELDELKDDETKTINEELEKNDSHVI